MNLLIRNYLQQKEEAPARYAWVCNRQSLNQKRSVNALFQWQTGCLKSEGQSLIELSL
jgi:hypothetical protein